MKGIKIFNESRTGFTKEFLELIKWQKASLNACNSIYKRFKSENDHDRNFALKWQLRLETARRAYIKKTFKRSQHFMTQYMTAPDEIKSAYVHPFKVIEENFNYSYKTIKLSVVGLRLW